VSEGSRDIDRAAAILRGGGLVAFPTETVYGLGADATNADAVRRIFAAKGRPATNPVIAHVADVATARRYTTRWPDSAQALAAAYWPGPLTLVLPKTPDIPDVVTAGRPTVGLRAPDHPLALELLRAFGSPIAAPSANRSNRVSPTTARHVSQEFGNAVELILDGGPCAVGIESTVLDLSGDVPRILRPGAVTRKQIEFVLGRVELAERITDQAVPAASPGRHAVHYAPRTPAYRFDAQQRGLIGTDEPYGRSNGIITVGTTRDRPETSGRIVAMPREPELYARHLYEVLRELDAMGLAKLFVEMPPDTPEWAAVRDRLLRATTPYATTGQ
jgi:L-threonylcarbamoyladenylate synthase